MSSDIETLLTACVHVNDDKIQAFVQARTELITRIKGDTSNLTDKVLDEL